MNKSLIVVSLKVLSGVSTFLLYIAFSHYLSPEKLGTYELALTLIMLFSTFFSLGFVPYASGEFTRRDIEDVGISTNKINTTYAVFAISLLILVFPIVFIFSESTKFSLIQWVIILLTSLLFFYKAIYSGVLQHTFRPIKYSVFEALYPVVIFCISIIYLYMAIGEKKIDTLLLSHLSALGIIFIYYLLEKHPKINFFVRISLNEFFQIIKISYPWFIVAIMSWVMFSSDKWVLEYFYSTKEVGLYSQIFKLSSAYNLLIVSTIAIVYTPYIYKSFRINDKDKTWKMINRQTLYLLLVTIVLLFLDFIWGEVVYKLLIGKQYYEAFKYNYLIVVNFMLTAIIGYYGYVFVYFNKTKFMQIALTFGMLINLMTSVLLTPILGIFGVIIATFVSQICILVYSINQSKKMLYMKFNFNQ